MPLKRLQADELSQTFNEFYRKADETRRQRIPILVECAQAVRDIAAAVYPMYLEPAGLRTAIPTHVEKVLQGCTTIESCHLCFDEVKLPLFFGQDVQHGKAMAVICTADVGVTPLPEALPEKRVHSINLASHDGMVHFQTGLLVILAQHAANKNILDGDLPYNMRMGIGAEISCSPALKLKKRSP